MERHHCTSPLSGSLEILPCYNEMLGWKVKHYIERGCDANSKSKNQKTKGSNKRASKERKVKWSPDFKNEKCLDLVEKAGRHILRGLACRRSRGRRRGVLRDLLLSGQVCHLTGGAWKSCVFGRLLGLCTCGYFVFALAFIVGGGFYDNRRDDLLLEEEKCGGSCTCVGDKTSAPSLSHPPWLPLSPIHRSTKCLPFPKPGSGSLALGLSAL